MEALGEVDGKDLHSQLLKYYGKDSVIYHEFDEGIDQPVYCRSCCEVVSGPAYVFHYQFVTENFHKSCVDLPRQIQHPLHPQHHLTAAVCVTDMLGEPAYFGFICDECRRYSSGVKYGCGKCHLNFDVRCVSKLEIQQLALKERIEIATPFHEHELQLFYHNMLLPTESFGDIICCCCSKGFQGSAYACIECRLFIHESCIDKVPQKVKSLFHPKHPLLICQTESVDICNACFERIHGLMLSCGMCISATFHISCCTRATSGLRLKYHEEHPMFYVRNSGMECVVCNNERDLRDGYGCWDCKVYVHMECIPLPRVIKHECHPYHALTLSDSTHVLKIASKEYRCVVCEKEGDPIHPCYYCEECSNPDIAHIDCVLSEDHPPSEKLEYLVPRSRDESDKEIHKAEKETKEQKAEKETKEQCSNELEQESFEAEEESLGREEEWKSNLEKSSLTELHEMSESIQREMKKLSSKLEVIQEIRVQKLNSLLFE